MTQQSQRQSRDSPQYVPKILHPFKSTLPILLIKHPPINQMPPAAAAAAAAAAIHEAKYRETIAHLLSESLVYQKMLKVMGDLKVGCKVGIRYADRTLYIDKPSIFQGTIRWLYGQTRDKIKEYIETEIMGSGGFIILMYTIITECTDIIALRNTSSAAIISRNLIKLYHNVCEMNISQLMQLSYGLSMIHQTYDGPNVCAFSLNEYIASVQRKIKEVRLELERLSHQLL